MDLIKQLITVKIIVGCKNTKLFEAIEQSNWITDELHLMLRISDVLFQCLFYELVKQKDFANNIQTLIIEEMKKLHVHFEFYPPTTKNGKSEWTSIMGPDKEKIFQLLNQFLPKNYPELRFVIAGYPPFIRDFA